jgi:hypothetical protein
MDPGRKERKISDQHSNAIQKQEENGSIKTTNNIGNKGRLRKEEKSKKKRRNTKRMRVREGSRADGRRKGSRSQDLPKKSNRKRIGTETYREREGRKKKDSVVGGAEENDGQVGPWARTPGWWTVPVWHVA